MARADALRGRNVLVAGAGVTGRSTVTALVELGANVTVTDGRAEALTDFGDLARPGLTAPPEGTDLVVTSPGWKPTSPLLVAAAERGIEVIGEVELAWRMSSGQVWLAVTGTDGKTTTVGMLESILRAAGAKAVACGNVGLPVVDAVRAGYEVLAVELSSYQLHWQDSLAVDAAVVLNLAEDHIEWHGSMEEYAKAKAKIYRGAKTRLHNADDEWSAQLADGGTGFTVHEPTGNNRYGIHDGWLVEIPTRPDELPADLSPRPSPQDSPPPNPGGVPAPVYRGQGQDQGVQEQLGTTTPAVDNSALIRLCPVDEVRPSGMHNVSNALAAAALARTYGVPPEAVREGLRTYEPQPHRVQLVGEIDGVRFVNDSKATNTHAAEGSLKAYDSIVWIAGGQLHGAEVDDLVASVSARLRGVLLLGADQEIFAQAIRRHAPEIPVKRLNPGDDEPMTAAVRAARDLARPGDVVLLAPAAKSHDMFSSYVHRGEAFIDAVAKAVQASA
nr:UDP-N-acetylmuramoyl-L-alanine--D-glutamate ligase [Kibdelosporangium sp. MJ126-NF4]CEL16893.1 UDP-N-acetylmuramoylalanine--D-glutamate ligase [Kibdelosporangium sp. MJ126-NF4]CTQ91878.1 UDP-N-acetylmuramoylalanine--D-glutamate ligase (EC 6.3.2.9) [Kibdelosporangium sp. MJ126-NF4]